jgi:hypothetical protein
MEQTKNNPLARIEAKIARAEGKASAEAHVRVEAKLAESVSAQAEAYQAAYMSTQATI